MRVRLESIGRLSWARCSTSYGAPMFSRCSRPPQPRFHTARRAAPNDASESSADLEVAPLVVKSVPLPRTPAAPPQPLPIEHSSAFLLRSRREPEGEAEQQPRAKRQPAEAFSGNAVTWALRKADESLDEIEENPPEAVKVIYDISRGPVGAAASKGVSTVAKVTWQVGTEAVKAAAPVGKWALQQSFKLAVTAVSKSIQGGSSKGNKGKK